MCILSKLQYGKLGVSNFFSKVVEEKLLGGRLDPRGTGRVNNNTKYYISAKFHACVTTRTIFAICRSTTSRIFHQFYSMLFIVRF